MADILRDHRMDTDSYWPGDMPQCGGSPGCPADAHNNTVVMGKA